MCLDTTAANTGCWKGNCVLLEQSLDEPLITCRHHILELVLKAVFECKFGSTTGPHPDIYKSKYKIGIDDQNV